MAADDKLGKQYRGQQFVPVKTPEQVAEDQAIQAEYSGDGAIALEVYFSMRGIVNPVMQASMRAFTRVQKATPADWDEIFKVH